MAAIKRVESMTMQVFSALIQAKDGRDLKTYLVERSKEQVDLGDGSTTPATWDDLAFWIRELTGRRVVRESVRTWAIRYGIVPDPKAKTDEGDAAQDGQAEKVAESPAAV